MSKIQVIFLFINLKFSVNENEWITQFNFKV